MVAFYLSVQKFHRLKSEERQIDETNLFKVMRVRVIKCESFAQKAVLL